MDRIAILKNPVQHYPWGSRTFIPELLGETYPSDIPHAELWMGAHPKGPSRVLKDGEWISLLELVRRSPQDILGKQVAEDFSNRFPFLFKVLALARPLSLQAHPNREQAREGFARENKLKISITAGHRNYKDQNHKPELICALMPFYALKGFRKVRDILRFMDKIDGPVFGKELNDLRRKPNSEGLKLFFSALMTSDEHRLKDIVDWTVTASANLSGLDPAFKWVLKLHHEYPGDIGLLFPILLNLIHLQPGEALYIPAGEPHAYLEGSGIELMANSDNVIRGGLTSKHRDIPELLKILTFREEGADILSPEHINNCERAYPALDEEFRLSVISLREEATFQSPKNRSVEIMITVDGNARIEDLGRGDSFSLKSGTSVIIPASVRQYRIEGEATIYKASPALTPLGGNNG